MISFPNAKINLGLNIIRKRPDGFHAIESCFYPIPWTDSLEIMESTELRFHTYGLEIPGEPSANLCMKAYEFLKADFPLPPIEIHLIKGIPMGAGMGGGSADGAFTLRVLNDLFDLKLTQKQLAAYALKLGSDCPFFIYNQPMTAKERGEELQPIDIRLAGYHLALYNPRIHISTKEAYAGVTPKSPESTIEDILSSPIATWKGVLKNDFEASIFPNHPEIKQIKDAMYESGALYAAMTGSGSTLYGLFEHPVDQPDWKWISL